MQCGDWGIERGPESCVFGWKSRGLLEVKWEGDVGVDVVAEEDRMEGEREWVEED